MRGKRTVQRIEGRSDRERARIGKPGFIKALISAALAGLCLSCAPKAHFPVGEALLRGETPPAPPTPDSLRAELELTGFQGGRKSTVSAALSAMPWRRYKLDVYGLPGMVEASFLWTDTGWALVLYEREGYLQGYGDTVELPGLGVGGVPVHDLFACLWGDFFPGDGAGDRDGASADRSAGGGHRGGGSGSASEPTGDTARDGSGRDSLGRPLGSAPPPIFPTALEKTGDGRLSYAAGGRRWLVSLDARTGVVREAAREDSAFRIVYEDYRLRNGRPVPKRIRVFAGKRPLLEIGVGTVEDGPKWKRNPFQIRIPKGFSRLRTPGKG